MASPSYNLLCSVIGLCVSVTFEFPFSYNGAENYFFIFRDSLFDPGNNQYISPDSYIPAYHLPYGKTYFPLHPNGRYSDGRLAPDFIGFVFSVFDYFTAVGNRIKNPTTYGFKFGDVACCGVGSHRGSSCGSLNQSYELCFNPSEYVYFDGAHNTEAVYSQLADIMWSVGAEVLRLPLSDLFEYEAEIKAKPKPSVWGPFDYSEL